VSNNPEERNYQLLRGGSLKSQKSYYFLQNGIIIDGSCGMSFLKNAALLGPEDGCNKLLRKSVLIY
jgi:hypothetical protein